MIEFRTCDAVPKSRAEDCARAKFVLLNNSKSTAVSTADNFFFIFVKSCIHYFIGVESLSYTCMMQKSEKVCKKNEKKMKKIEHDTQTIKDQRKKNCVKIA